jgi:sortase A
MSNRTPPSPTWVTWFSGRAFVALGMLLALGAVALPVWWLTQPPVTAEANAPVEPEPPILLPETPLLEELLPVGEEPDPDPPPRPTPRGYVQATREPVRPPERLVIPSIDLDAPVVPVGWATVQVGDQSAAQWQVPDTATAGWHDTSAGVGQRGNTVLNGHHNVYGQVFIRLVDVAVGDELQLEADGRLYDFVVTETAILPEMDQPIEVRLANAARIQPTADERVTLVTCWPYSGNSHRLIVVAKPASLELLKVEFR